MTLEQKKSRTTSLEIFNRIPVLVFGITSVCFILGLLIVNLGQAQYGIYSFDFIRTEYILVGAVFLFLIICSQLIFIRISFDLKSIPKSWNERKYGYIAIEVFSSLMVFTGIFQFIFLTCFNMTFPFNEWWGWSTAIILIMLGQLAVAGYKEAVIFSSGGLLGNNISVKPGNPGFIVLVATGLLSLIAVYANVTYPHISPALGGGKKAPVLLFPTSEGMEVCKALALPVRNNNIVGPLNFLTETEREIVILIPDELTGKSIAIRINRGLFHAIQATNTNK